MLPRIPPVELVSPLPLQDCLRLLRENMDPPRSLFGKRPIIGHVEGTRLLARKRIRYRNAFKMFVTADLSEQNGHTYLRCAFGMQRYLAIATAIWFAGAVLIGGVLMVQGLEVFAAKQFAMAVNDWISLLWLPGMAVFCTGVVWHGRWLSRDDPEILTDFLRSTLRAKDAGIA